MRTRIFSRRRLATLQWPPALPRLMVVPLLSALTLAAAMLLLSWPGLVDADEEVQGWLGVSLQQLTPTLREAMDISSDAGVLVTEVSEDSPAEQAGFQEGDVIVRYNETDIASPRRLMKMVRKTEPGTKAKITVFRKGKEKTLTAHIGELDEDKESRFRIILDDENEDLLMDFDENAFALGLPGLSWILQEHHLWLGIKPMGLTEQLADYFEVKDGRGVLVAEVLPDSPAEKAELKAGDVIVRLDDERIEDTWELREEIEEYEEGDQVTLAVIRQGKETSIPITLEESPRGEDLALTKKLEKMPHKMKKFRLQVPSEELMDIYLDEELDEKELEKLEEHLEDLEEELEERLEELEEKLEKLQGIVEKK
jgi:membrane-associated protease RseP (regulator of RpoE activity)